MAARLGGNNNAQPGGRGGAEGRGRGRGPSRGRGGYSGPRRDDAQEVSTDAEAVSRGDNGYRGRGGGGGGGYRGRGGRGGDDRRPAKHEYERRDASGRGYEFPWLFNTCILVHAYLSPGMKHKRQLQQACTSAGMRLRRSMVLDVGTGETRERNWLGKGTQMQMTRGYCISLAAQVV